MIPLLVDLEARWRMHDHDGAGWLMVLLMLLFVAAVVVIAVVFLRGSLTTQSAGPSPGASTRSVDARAILQERFARGEIDEPDFRSRMRALDETTS